MGALSHLVKQALFTSPKLGYEGASSGGSNAHVAQDNASLPFFCGCDDRV